MLLHMNMYEFICNIYEFLNLVGSYDPCYDPPIHDLMGPTRSYLGSRVCLPWIHLTIKLRFTTMGVLDSELQWKIVVDNQINLNNPIEGCMNKNK